VSSRLDILSLVVFSGDGCLSSIFKGQVLGGLAQPHFFHWTFCGPRLGDWASIRLWWQPPTAPPGAQLRSSTDDWLMPSISGLFAADQCTARYVAVVVCSERLILLKIRHALSGSSSSRIIAMYRVGGAQLIQDASDAGLSRNFV
jgi:hypothetical protein